MITNIKLHNVASYVNPVEINDLKRINFIYGSNGTGKTTFSNFLYDSTNLKYSDCNKKWKDDTELNVLVYNKKFREDYFGESKLKGVFTLGKASKEEIDTINTKKDELKNLKEQYVKRKSSLDKLIEEKSEKSLKFKEKVWKGIYQKHKTYFKEAFVGSMKSKDAFYNRIIKEFNSNEEEFLVLDVLKTKSQTIFGEAPKHIESFTVIEFEKLLEIEEDKIWEKKVIGKADVEIAKLIQKLNINDWVIKGKNLLKETDRTCPFCQEETITVNFKKQLDKFFDENFTNDLKQIKGFNDEYLREAATIVNQLNEIEKKEKENKKTKLNISLFSANLKTLISELTANREFLQNKLSEPSRVISLQSIKQQLSSLNLLLIEANKSIEKHNKIVLDYRSQRDNLINSIWKHLVEDNKVELDNYVKENDGLTKAVEGIKKQYDDFNEKHRLLKIDIDQLSINVTSSEPTVIQINNTLKTYGFQSFTIVPSSKEENHYEIQREDGSPAESTLSEGEKTFITFLYFLQIAKGSLEKGKTSVDKILVIDDPISSLDSNILYVVSTLIKRILKEVRSGEGDILQVILLTHNVFFHKEVSFIDGRTSKLNNTNYWILRKKNRVTSIQMFEQENPIHSSYELLWKELKEGDSLVSIQNTMRRIIENYFRILGKYRDDTLVNKFETPEEQDICRALISWINDGSHSINDDLYIEYQDETIASYKKVFKSIFEKSHHKEHYKMMMEEN
ncbi:AAA family ATPase [uncultured Tenacibaculum sp.]|uniref:AAA family ATPase n=1 Tax=uncultured Tenacibaculum sp. TaxID=174713 RepID=UPI00263965F4|nr:AAA family ATPase [uncultured Tenacibaculum sp.]